MPTDTPALTFDCGCDEFQSCPRCTTQLEPNWLAKELEDVTMPNPVAELVQKLRARADMIVAAHEAKGRKIERPFCLEDLAADLLERLSRERDTAHAVIEDIAGASWGTMAPKSATPVAMTAKALTIDKAAKYLEAHGPAPIEARERDTGVPEGFWLAPIEPTQKMLGDFPDLNAEVWAEMRSAAPQPPTVSGWQDISTAPKDGTTVLLCAATWDSPRTGWTFANDPWQDTVIDGNPTHWMPLGPPGETPAHVPDLLTVTRERDQARYQLAEIAKQCELADDPEHHTLGLIKHMARSVLHPEKPEVTHDP